MFSRTVLSGQIDHVSSRGMMGSYTTAHARLVNENRSEIRLSHALGEQLHWNGCAISESAGLVGSSSRRGSCTDETNSCGFEHEEGRKEAVGEGAERGGFLDSKTLLKGSGFRTQCTRHACSLSTFSLQISLREQRRSDGTTVLIHLSKQYEASVCGAVFQRPNQTMSGWGVWAYLHSQQRKKKRKSCCGHNFSPKTCKRLKRWSETSDHQRNDFQWPRWVKRKKKGPPHKASNCLDE